jgi:metal-sulfur cluster biosynthetic enzyme
MHIATQQHSQHPPQQAYPQMRLLLCLATTQVAEAQAGASLNDQILAQLRNIIDPDFDEDIVACGFVKNLVADEASGQVSATCSWRCNLMHMATLRLQAAYQQARPCAVNAAKLCCCSAVFYMQPGGCWLARNNCSTAQAPF